MTKTASVIGLGKLGAPLAACLAAKGLRVIGVDADPHKVEKINQGGAPVFEPQLEEFIRAAKGRLFATSNSEEAVLASEITFIVVATPSETSGAFSLRYVLPVCEAIGRALRTKHDFHLVVLTSTVMPGTTGGEIRATLEKASGKRAGQDFGLCYGPEFIALGSVIHDFLNPDFVLIGESDPRSGAILESLYKEVCENSPAVRRMNFVNAEITKLSINTYVTTKISFANMLARICEKLPEANVDIVTAALGLDSRIGPKYLKGAVSYGGPCFPRDNRALAALAQQVDAPADLARAIDHFNRSQIHWLAALVEQLSSEGEAAGILGLTYKPNTDVVEESVGFLLAQQLVERGVEVVAYDPFGNQKALLALGSKVRFAATAQECIEGTAVVVLATPWREFAEIPASQWARHSSPRTVVDCWRVLEHLCRADGVRYLSLGTGDLLVSSFTVGAH
jgi:UDPglucose 6-dehydrogenase